MAYLANFCLTFLFITFVSCREISSDALIEPDIIEPEPEPAVPSDKVVLGPGPVILPPSSSSSCSPEACNNEYHCPLIPACGEGSVLKPGGPCNCCDVCVKILGENDCCTAPHTKGLPAPDNEECDLTKGLACINGKCKKVCTAIGELETEQQEVNVNEQEQTEVKEIEELRNVSIPAELEEKKPEEGETLPELHDGTY